MADREPLVFAPPRLGRRTTRQSPRPRLQGPGPAIQSERLGGSLQRLTAAFDRGALSATRAPEALPPEQILVLEIAGELKDFAAAVRRVSGLEFLADEALDKIDSDDQFAAVDNKGRQHKYARELFLVASDATAWRQLLSLWEQFQEGKKFQRGLTPFRDLFSRLRDIRAWNDVDRLTRTGAIEMWEAELDLYGNQLMPFEIELWLRSDPEKRDAAVNTLRADLTREGGSVLATSVIEEIGYHGVLGEVPAQRLREVMERGEVRWMSTGAVRFFHGVGQVAAPRLSDADQLDDPISAEPKGSVQGGPRIAVLDGVPIAEHETVAGRLRIDDPDDLESTTAVDQRRHGTGITSLVVNGDLSSPTRSQAHPVYVRPILEPGPAWVHDAPEELPRRRLAVDTINIAVSRLFEGERPAAPDTAVVVLAVGDRVQQFDQFISPLARLLDWLAFEYGVLFIVPAGNHPLDLTLPLSIDATDPQELQHEVLCAMQRTAAYRRLLAPGEAVNALTVGAAHGDGSQASLDGRADPMVTPDLPNVVSALGAGIKQAVKPDLLLPGGRQLVRLEPVTGADQLASIALSSRAPGVRMAAPGGSQSRLTATTFAAGTSVATALGGHAAGLLIDDLDAFMASQPPDLRDRLRAVPIAVLVKAAMAHTASWGSAPTFLSQALEEINGRAPRAAVARFIGYGLADPANAMRDFDHRVTAITADRLQDGQEHEYRFPLPPSLASRAIPRRLTITLAWLTPINPEHRAYRRAALAVDPVGPALPEDRVGVDFYGSRRGTIQHNVLEDSRAVPYVSGAAIELAVTCRADAGTLSQSVPYATFVTLEVPESAGVAIHQEVRQGLGVLLRSPVRVPARP